MDSGIYELTFANGDTYIGKSLHLKTRWKQHADKLEKGTAARNMLDAFKNSRNKMPKVKVLLECHPDVLDEYENYFINAERPTLNTQRPAPRSDEEIDALVRHANRGSAVYSVPVLIITLENYSTSETALTTKCAELASERDELESTWDIRAVRDARAIDKYVEIETDRDYFKQETKRLTAQCRDAEQRWARVLRATWWQRLWKTW